MRIHYKPLSLRRQYNHCKVVSEKEQENDRPIEEKNSHYYYGRQGHIVLIPYNKPRLLSRLCPRFDYPHLKLYHLPVDQQVQWSPSNIDRKNEINIQVKSYKALS